MANLTVKEYVNYLSKSGLIDSDQLSQTLGKFQQLPPEKSGDWRVLARMLVASNLITRWQNRKLVEGRFRGFFLGKYKLLSLIGEGGMSSVYLAEHTVMRRRVALKVLPRDLVEDEAHLKRFYIESQATAALDHPNIVRAYDVDNEGKLHYLVMEYVDGPDLEREVRENGELAYETAADYIRQTADGLAHAHERGMIHRDIKPANLLITGNGTVKVLDMGLAQFDQADGGSDDNVLGTTDFMAPEQAIDSKTVDARADIYSLGCTMYYLLTAKPPFEAPTLAEVLLKHQTKDPKDIREFRADAPKDLIDICFKMMAKKREDRHQTAKQVSDALNQWLKNHHVWSISGQRSQEEEESQMAFLEQVDADRVEKSTKRSNNDPELLEFFSAMSEEPAPSGSDSFGFEEPPPEQRRPRPPERRPERPRTRPGSGRAPLVQRRGPMQSKTPPPTKGPTGGSEETELNDFLQNLSGDEDRSDEDSVNRFLRGLEDDDQPRKPKPRRPRRGE